MNRLLRWLSGLLAAEGVLWCIFLLWQYNIGALVATIVTVVSIVAFIFSWTKTEIAAGVAFAASVAWILEMAELLENKLFFPQLRLPVFLVIILLFTALALLFVSAKCWQSENDKKFRPALITTIAVILLTLPLSTFVYKTIDIDHIKISASRDHNNFSLVLDNGKSHFAISEFGPEHDRNSQNNILRGLNRSDSEWRSSPDCKIRLHIQLGMVKSFELIRNNETGNYFDDNEIGYTTKLRYGKGIFDINEQLLRW